MEEAHKTAEKGQTLQVERVQIGVRIEKRMVKVLKALAEYHDISLGDLLEALVLHAFENKAPFSGETLEHIAQLKKIYGMNYDASYSHRLKDISTPSEK